MTDRTDSPYDFDLFVIGAGSGGVRASRVAAAHSARVAVADTGHGIAAAELVRVFHMGVTTRAEGHGFGLHSAANAATEMGGRLWAESEGPGRGARFVLELPIRAEGSESASGPSNRGVEAR